MIGVLFSGGVESMVCAHMAHATGDLISLHLVNFGQASFDAQATLLHAAARKFNCEAHVIDIPYKQYSETLASDPVFRFGGKPDRAFHRNDLDRMNFPGVPYMNGRNPLFMLHAAVQASYRGANRLWVGFQVNDIELGDQTAPFTERANDATGHVIDMVNSLIYASFEEPFMVHAPLLSMNKRQIMALSRSYGIDLTETLSCDYYPPCGICSQCQDRAEGERASQ